MVSLLRDIGFVDAAAVRFGQGSDQRLLDPSKAKSLYVEASRRPDSAVNTTHGACAKASPPPSE